jgi:hypothetical protein
MVGSLLAGKDYGAVTDAVRFTKAMLNPLLFDTYIKTIVLTRVWAVKNPQDPARVATAVGGVRYSGWQLSLANSPLTALPRAGIIPVAPRRRRI